ncbi:MAG: hypothetical protein AAGN66_27860 [Acidobacteriota bacterium]
MAQERHRSGEGGGAGPDAQGNLAEARTNEQGVFELLDVPLTAPHLCGIYSQEQFAVGSKHLPRSASLSYEISCRAKTSGPGPKVKRADASFPHYQLGDSARLEITTDPPVPNAPIYTWRTKDGAPEREALPLMVWNAVGVPSPAYTDALGRFSTVNLLDDAGACGSYTEESFAVGSPSAPRSGTLAFVVYCPNAASPAVTRPDGRFPNYHLGDLAALRIVTDPPQPRQRVYAWRTKDGEVERSAYLLTRSDGQGGVEPIRTDDAGVLEIAEVELSDPEGCGSYTLEQFAVGDTRGPRSAPLSFEVHCPAEPQAPSATRNDGNFPSYLLGDLASLRIVTHPPQPFSQVYGWRTQNGQVERDGEPVYFIDPQGIVQPMVTDAAGVFERIGVPLDDPGVCAEYTGEQFAVGSPSGPRSAPVSYTVSCGGPAGAPSPGR